jgi:hypothetical protein
MKVRIFWLARCVADLLNSHPNLGFILVLEVTPDNQQVDAAAYSWLQSTYQDSPFPENQCQCHPYEWRVCLHPWLDVHL